MARFDKRIAVEHQFRTPDENGNVLQSWTLLAKLWASVRETPGREAVAAGRVEQSHTATVWLRTGRTARSITGMDRIIYRDLVWNIQSAIPGERDGVIELLISTDGEKPT